VGGRFWAICGAFGIMTKYTQKQLREMVKNGVAVDVTNAGGRGAIPENYRQIGYARGVYGCNGMLLQGCDSGTLYAVTARTTAIYIF
jgi:hypothetical protein